MTSCAPAVTEYGPESRWASSTRPTSSTTSTLLAAWNAATYVAQIEDERLTAAMGNTAYLDATRAVLGEPDFTRAWDAGRTAGDAEIQARAAMVMMRAGGGRSA